jgi:Cys-rich protein (TIGR01571 family)
MQRQLTRLCGGCGRFLDVDEDFIHDDWTCNACAHRGAPLDRCPQDSCVDPSPVFYQSSCVPLPRIRTASGRGVPTYAAPGAPLSSGIRTTSGRGVPTYAAPGALFSSGIPTYSSPTPTPALELEYAAPYFSAVDIAEPAVTALPPSPTGQIRRSRPPPPLPPYLPVDKAAADPLRPPRTIPPPPHRSPPPPDAVGFGPAGPPQKGGPLIGFGGWFAGLFGCLRDPALCCMSWFCPCIPGGRTVSWLRWRPESALFLVLYLFFGCCMEVWSRYEIRRRYGIPGSFLEDLAVVWCCFPCAVQQDAHQTGQFGLEEPRAQYLP